MILLTIIKHLFPYQTFWLMPHYLESKREWQNEKTPHTAGLNQNIITNQTNH